MIIDIEAAGWTTGQTAGTTWFNREEPDFIRELRRLGEHARNIGGWEPADIWEEDETNWEDKVEWNPKEKRYEVQLAFTTERAKKFFKTKRSALRYLKRHQDRLNGIKKRKKPITKAKMRELQQQEEENYFERLGLDG